MSEKQFSGFEQSRFKWTPPKSPLDLNNFALPQITSLRFRKDHYAPLSCRLNAVTEETLYSLTEALGFEIPRELSLELLGTLAAGSQLNQKKLARLQPYMETLRLEQHLSCCSTSEYDTTSRHFVLYRGEQHEAWPNIAPALPGLNGLQLFLSRINEHTDIELNWRGSLPNNQREALQRWEIAHAAAESLGSSRELEKLGTLSEFVDDSHPGNRYAVMLKLGALSIECDEYCRNDDTATSKYRVPGDKPENQLPHNQVRTNKTSSRAASSSGPARGDSLHIENPSGADLAKLLQLAGLNLKPDTYYYLLAGMRENQIFDCRELQQSAANHPKNIAFSQSIEYPKNLRVRPALCHVSIETCTNLAGEIELSLNTVEQYSHKMRRAVTARLNWYRGAEDLQALPWPELCRAAGCF